MWLGPVGCWVPHGALTPCNARGGALALGGLEPPQIPPGHRTGLQVTSSPRAAGDSAHPTLLQTLWGLVPAYGTCVIKRAMKAQPWSCVAVPGPLCVINLMVKATSLPASQNCPVKPIPAAMSSQKPFQPWLSLTHSLGEDRGWGERKIKH